MPARSFAFAFTLLLLLAGCVKLREPVPHNVNSGELEELDLGMVTFLNPREVQRVAKANFPVALKYSLSSSVQATVNIVCNPDGTVANVEWVEGDEVIREAVVKAAKTARFAPRPSSFRVRLPFMFLVSP